MKVGRAIVTEMVEAVTTPGATKSRHRTGPTGARDAAEGRISKGRAIGLACAVFFACTVFTLLSLSASANYGRLTHDIVWDDVSYFNQGYRLYLALRDGGLAGFLNDYATHPPRSAFGAIAAAGGFLIFGVNDWAPYVMNWIVVAVFLGFAAYLVRRESMWLIGAAMIFLLSTPMAMIAVVDFKPDLLNALCITMASIFLLEERSECRENRRFAIAGAVFGAAILAKATTFPFTMLMAGLAFVSAVGVRAISRAHWFNLRHGIRLGLVFGLAFLLVAGLHLAVAGPHIVEYIRTNSFGEHRDVWAVAGGFLFQIGYYFSGPGSAAMGAHKWFAVAVGIGSLAVVFWRGDSGSKWSAIVVLGLGLFAYAFFSANAMKNGHLGFTAQTFLFIGSVFFLVQAKHSLGPIQARRFEVLMSAVMASSVLFFDPGRSVDAKFWFWDGDGPERREVNQRILDALFEEVPREAGCRTVYIATTGLLNHDTLQWLTNKSGRCFEFVGTDANAGVAEALDQALHKDYTIVAETGTEGQYEWFPSNQIGSKIGDALAADERFRFVAAVLARNGKEFSVFRSIENAPEHPFFGWRHSQNLLSFENPNFLYGMTEQPEVEFTTMNADPVLLDAVVVTRVSGDQVVTVLLNGVEVAEAVLSKDNPRHQFSLPLHPQAGANTLAFHCSNTEPYPSKDGKRWSVVFPRLRIMPDSARN